MSIVSITEKADRSQINSFGKMTIAKFINMKIFLSNKIFKIVFFFFNYFSFKTKNIFPFKLERS